MKGQRLTSHDPTSRAGDSDQQEEAKYSQSQEEVDWPKLPGEEPCTAEISYDHRQEVLMERGDRGGEVTPWKGRRQGQGRGG